jgi:hypothetical protein
MVVLFEDGIYIDASKPVAWLALKAKCTSKAIGLIKKP